MTIIGLASFHHRLDLFLCPGTHQQWQGIVPASIASPLQVQTADAHRAEILDCQDVDGMVGKSPGVGPTWHALAPWLFSLPMAQGEGCRIHFSGELESLLLILGKAERLFCRKVFS